MKKVAILYEFDLLDNYVGSLKQKLQKAYSEHPEHFLTMTLDTFEELYNRSEVFSDDNYILFIE